MIVYLRNFNKYKGLLWQLVARDLKVRYRKSVLGYLWSLLNPLLTMVVISTVFSYVFRFDIDNFPIYLLTGQILFNFFSEATNQSMDSILQGSGLIKKVYIPKYIFPLSRTLSSFVNLIFSLLAIIIMLFLTKTPFRLTLIAIPIPLIYLLIFTCGVSLILSVFAVYFRDILHIYSVVLTAWMYFTPIFYPISALPDLPKKLIFCNPLYHYITYFRQIILEGTIPGFRENIMCCLISGGMFAVGLIVFKNHQDRFSFYI